MSLPLGRYRSFGTFFLRPPAYNVSMALKPDDTICFCFHVPLRKIESFCRREKPQAASQISACLSAGTGCGWCIPMLRKIHLRICGACLPPWHGDEPAEELRHALQPDAADPSIQAVDYAAGRQQYLARTRKQPPKE
jgi:bacterioferritin-associated ferredoxin